MLWSLNPDGTLTNGLYYTCPLRSDLWTQRKHWALTWPLLHVSLGSEHHVALAQMLDKGRGFLPDWPQPLGVTV